MPQKNYKKFKETPIFSDANQIIKTLHNVPTMKPKNIFHLERRLNCPQNDHHTLRNVRNKTSVQDKYTLLMKNDEFALYDRKI